MSVRKFDLFCLSYLFIYHDHYDHLCFGVELLLLLAYCYTPRPHPSLYFRNTV